MVHWSVLGHIGQIDHNIHVSNIAISSIRLSGFKRPFKKECRVNALCLQNSITVDVVKNIKPSLKGKRQAHYYLIQENYEWRELLHYKIAERDGSSLTVNVSRNLRCR